MDATRTLVADLREELPQCSSGQQQTICKPVRHDRHTRGGQLDGVIRSERKTPAAIACPALDAVLELVDLRIPRIDVADALGEQEDVYVAFGARFASGEGAERRGVGWRWSQQSDASFEAAEELGTYSNRLQDGCSEQVISIESVEEAVVGRLCDDQAVRDESPQDGGLARSGSSGRQSGDPTSTETRPSTRKHLEHRGIERGHEGAERMLEVHGHIVMRRASCVNYFCILLSIPPL